MAEEVDHKFLDFVVKGLVDNPKDVKIERTIDEMGVLLTLNINPADMGQIIGRQGQTARAIRTLLKIVGAKNNARVNLKIYEPEGSRPPRKRREESTAATMDTAPEARSESTDDLLGTDMPDINI
mgnify:CR=1 FL=1